MVIWHLDLIPFRHQEHGATGLASWWKHVLRPIDNKPLEDAKSAPLHGRKFWVMVWRRPGTRFEA